MSEDAARMELGPDAWHQNDEGEYYLDCPECGSAATLTNVVKHGRCNGYLDQQEGETELDEAAMDCTAVLSLELVYTSDTEGSVAEDVGGRDVVGTGDEAGGADSGGGDDQAVDPEYDDSPAPGK